MVDEVTMEQQITIPDMLQAFVLPQVMDAKGLSLQIRTTKTAASAAR